MNLKDRVVMITGAGGGLGKELVREFLARTSRVVALVRNENAVSELREMGNQDRLLIYVADVADSSSVNAAVDGVVKEWGRVDVLFNNAAVYPKINFLRESAEDWEKVVQTNINGPAICCKAVLPLMLKNKFGRIYNLGSFADKAPIRNSAAYSASKGAVHALTKGIARDVEELDADIEVHEWIPGHMNTKMSGFTGQSPSLSASWAVDIVSGGVPYSSKSTIFENNREWLPPRSLKQRLLDRVRFWR